MSSNELILPLVIILALGFNFVNGFHDTANSIATSIATKSLRPTTAIILASFLEMIGSLTSTKVAETLGKNIILPGIITIDLIVAALISAILWNLLTWYFAIPSSSSHALIGGLVGAAIVKAWSFSAIIWQGLIYKVILPLFLAPLIGLISGGIFMIVLLWLLKPLRPNLVNKIFSKLQIVSASLVAFSHGANDAQKSMGIIALALLASGATSQFHVPTWATISCAVTLALGTATGGWKIIKTMGNNICKLKPVNGFAAQTATAIVINSATFLIGAPVSTTHIISSSIMGVGATKRISAVRWKVAADLVYTWLITIPTCAILAGIIYKFISLI